MRFGKAIATGLAVTAALAGGVAQPEGVTLHGAGRHATTAAALPADEAARVVRGERVAMGTVFRVVVAAAKSTAVGAAIDEVLDEVQRLDRVLSHYDPSSEAAHLAQTLPGSVQQVTPDLYAALERSLEMTALSDGRFDVTLGRVTRLWRAAAAGGRTPTAAELDEARRCAGAHLVTLVPPGGVQLDSACLAFDFGGIGKGIAVERALDILRARGIGDAIVNAGGSTMKAIGDAPGHEGWPVQVPGRSEPVFLRDRALSISQAAGETLTRHAPSPLAGRATVTVVVEDAALADALSTALLLSGVADGRAMARQVEGAGAWWTEGDVVVATAGVVPASVALAGGTR